MIPVYCKSGHEMLGTEENSSSRSTSRTTSSFSFLGKRVTSTETNIVNSSQHPGNDCGRALRSDVRRKS